jgi:hypothetical protein
MKTFKASFYFLLLKLSLYFLFNYTMKVDSVEDGVSKLRQISRSTGQFPKAGIILESTVKHYVANLDNLYEQVIDFKHSLTKNIFSRFLSF